MRTKSCQYPKTAALLLSFCIFQANAQNDTADNQTIEAGSEALKAGEKLKSPPLSVKASGKSPAQLLKQDLSAQGIKTEPAWDRTKQRYLHVSEFEVPIKGTFTAKTLIDRLNLANLAMSIVAMQDFAEFLGQKTEFQANLSMGGSPVGRLYMQEQEQFQKEMDALEKELAQFKSKLDKAKSSINKADAAEVAAQRELETSIAEQEKVVRALNQKAIAGPSTLDKLNIAAEAMLMKVDANFTRTGFQAQTASTKEKVSGELQELKAKRDAGVSGEAATARQDYAALQTRIESLVVRIKEKKEAAQKFFDEYVETHLNSKYNYRADYDIVGLTPIKYYYGIIPNKSNGQTLVVAGAYAWSPALERDTRAILHETGHQANTAAYTERFPVSSAIARKGDKTLGEWLVEQKDQLDTFGPGRWYVDNEGVRYWLGCAYALKGSGAQANISYRAVRQDATRNLGLSLNVKFQVEGTKEDSLSLNGKDSDVASKLEQLAKIQRVGLDIASEACSDEFTLPVENGQESEPIRVYIAKVSEDEIRAAHKAVLQQAENAAKAHEGRYRREGVRKAASDSVNAAKDNKAPMGEAYSATRNELDAGKLAKGAGSAAKAGNGSGNVVVLQPATNAPGSGSIQPFIKGDKSKVPDDF